MKTDRIIQLISLIIILFCLTNCSKWCAKHSQTSVKDSISYIEKVVIDTIKVELPSDTTIIFTPMDCHDQEINTENSKQKVKIIIKDRVLKGEFICKADSLERIITSLRSEKKAIKETIIKVPVKFTPWWVKWSIFLLILITLVEFGYIVFLKLFK